MLLTAKFKTCLFNKVLIFLAMISFSFSVKSQDPMFSQFMFKQLYFNPAYAGTTESPRLMGGYRNQWLGMDNAFTTYYITYDQNISNLKSGFGFSVLRDDIGNSTFNLTGFDFSYNYQTELSRSLNISFGLSAGIYQKALNAGNIVLPDQSPYETGNVSENISSTSHWYPDFGFGIHSYFRDKHWVSVAVHHLNRPNVSMNENVSRLPLRFTFHYVTSFKKYLGKFSDKPLFFKPGIIYQQHSRYNYISAGSNTEFDPLIYGAWFRSDQNFAVESLILLVGYKIYNFRFVYSYDMRLINFSKNVINNGAHEVTFQIDFKYNDRKKMRQVKCPKF